MKILLDTHAFFWWVKKSVRLSRTAREQIEDTNIEILVSAVFAWELAVKSELGKWPEAHQVVNELELIIPTAGFLPPAITVPHARLAGLLKGSHKDPFDRLLAAQPRLEQAAFISADPVFPTFGVATLW